MRLWETAKCPCMHFLLAIVRSHNPQRLGRESDRGVFLTEFQNFQNYWRRIYGLKRIFGKHGAIDLRNAQRNDGKDESNKGICQIFA
jgi:hypothetical protein